MEMENQSWENVPKDLDRKIRTAVAVLMSKNAVIDAKARSLLILWQCDLELAKYEQ